MWEENANPSVRWGQLLVLAALTAFVGAMWGMERATVPLIARQDFGIASAAVTLSFVVGFGLTKTFANLGAGALMDRIGRKRVLVMGWIAGIPVPLLIIWAPSWGWIVGANLLLGVNQGLCWTATILMMMDVVNGERRGFATGLNEFAGYGGVAVLTLATGFLAAEYAPRPQPFILGIVIAGVGLAASVLLVRDTVVRTEEGAAPSFRSTFVDSVRDHTLLSLGQAGLVTKINDATVWGLLPLALDARGFDVARVGVVAAIFPLVWGVSQLGAGILSDYLGRKPLILAGMVLQSTGMWVLATAGGAITPWIAGVSILGLGAAAVYPTLIAAVGDRAHPLRRASAIGIYRSYRDSGFIAGALVAGVLADAFGFRWAFFAVGVISLLSALGVGVWMVEAGGRRGPLRAFRDSP
jgi:MFS family permease